eukprot:CAMPEP_0179018624 /NCGR_PEP_ID=MMETSP0796-20121207/4449_1 /TAXON_ID=73915 /ORGANISM="Pyrodinium bahamense, Strain pbaha01" /LENGTH=346 /DNA_ID=CAMNT_0020714387 /DNA_START=1 /DNA_END=1037 /DNA_ORIENTATION=+
MSRYKQINDLDVGDDFVLPEGNVLRGQLLFKKHCSQCHTIRRDGLNPYGTLWGPNLYGVMGRTAAQNQRSGWSKYSVSLEESGILWTERNMMAFLKNPRAFAGGAINMNFRGIESFQDRVDLVHYLQRAGHESWMVQDGTPHTQKRWWTRGQEGQTQSYWQVHANDKQLKPWQHLSRAAAGKVNELRQSAFGWIGWDPTPRSAGSGSDGCPNEDDPEVTTWRRVQKVADGVRPASMQRSFNWPPPEVIAEGPVKRRKPPAHVPSSSAASSTSPIAAEQAPRPAAPIVVAACEERVAAPLLPSGIRAPSGLMVHRVLMVVAWHPVVLLSMRSRSDGSRTGISALFLG